MFDGPYYLFKIVTTKTQGNPYDIHRFFSHWIYEFLPVIYSKIKTFPSFKIAAALYNISMILPVYLTFLFMFRYLKNSNFLYYLFLIVLNGIAVFTFHVSESNIALYIFVLVMCELEFLSRQSQVHKINAFILFPLMILIAAVHPGSIIYMPLIFMGLFRNKKILGKFFIPLSVIGFISSLYQIQGFIRFKTLAHGDYSYFFEMNAKFYQNGFIVTSLILLGLFLIRFFKRYQYHSVIDILAFAGLLIYYFYFKNSFNPLHNYIARSVNFALPPIIIGCLLLFKSKNNQKSFVSLFIICLILFGFHTGLRYHKWNQFKHRFVDYLQSQEGIKNIKETPFDNQKDYGYVYRYCAEGSSIFLQSFVGKKVKTIIKPNERSYLKIEFNEFWRDFFLQRGIKFYKQDSP